MSPEEIRKQILGIHESANDSGIRIPTSDISPNVAAIKQDAEAGSAESQFELGKMYEHGRNLPENKSEAVKWYKLAAAQGEHRAQNNLGKLYIIGEGVEKDTVEGERLLTLAADAGRPKAQYGLGILYLGLWENCPDSNKNEELGRKYLQKSAEQCFEPAIQLLAKLPKLSQPINDSSTSINKASYLSSKSKMVKTAEQSNKKNYWIAMALAVVFGPFGLFYVSWKRALAVLAIWVAAVALFHNPILFWLVLSAGSIVLMGIGTPKDG